MDVTITHWYLFFVYIVNAKTLFRLKRIWNESTQQRNNWLKIKLFFPKSTPFQIRIYALSTSNTDFTHSISLCHTEQTQKISQLFFKSSYFIGWLLFHIQCTTNDFNSSIVQNLPWRQVNVYFPWFVCIYIYVYVLVTLYMCACFDQIRKSMYPRTISFLAFKILLRIYKYTVFCVVVYNIIPFSLDLHYTCVIGNLWINFKCDL